MAIYHCNVRVGSKSSDKSAGAKSAYITRTEKYSKDSQEVITSWSENMPLWAKETPNEYWKSADLYERKNGVLFREVEIALPIELSVEKNKNLTLDFCRYLTAEKSLPYTVAIHAGKGNNPHAHILISERMNDGHDRTPETWFRRAANKGKSPATGGAKKADLGKSRKSWLESTRAKWAEIANKHLEIAGYSERIDHRSYEELGIDKIPSVHLGPNVVEMEEKGIETDRGDRNLVVEMDNKEIEKLKAEERYIDECIRENKERQRDTGLDRSHRANGTIDGEIERREQGADRRNRIKQQASSRRVEQEPERSFSRNERDSSKLEQSIRNYHGNNEQHQKIFKSAGLQDMGSSLVGGVYPRDSAASRIFDLAGLGDIFSRKRAAHTGDLFAMKGDRTVQAVRRQLKAMGCKNYEVGIRDAETGKMMNKTWAAKEIEKNVPWLKRMNAQGNDIYIRPGDDKTNLLLIDDVDGVTVEQMTEDDCNPALVVETSPKNYQVWVKLSKVHEGIVRKEIARGLAKKYNGDMNSADAKHYGRLAGFTNRKSEYQEYGRNPYVLCRQSSGVVSSKSLQLESWGIQQAEQVQLKSKKLERQLAILTTNTKKARPDSVTAYRQEAYKLYSSAGGNYGDISRLDWLVANNLLERGYSPQNVKKAILEASPDILSRKTGHVEDYIDRTVGKAVEKQREKGLPPSRNRGMGMGM
ncbi:MAG: DNA primase [Gammaproteobacteria bacterium]|nr:MAG: DNA primase [Gammaproteobacteria bacterium]